MKQISIKSTNLIIKNLRLKLRGHEKQNNNEYILYCYKYNDTSISIYNTNSIVLQGDDCEKTYQFLFNKSYISQNIENDNKNNDQIIYFKQNENNIVGSDETGVGDFFGGMTVCACFVNKKDCPFLIELGVKDSKKLTDNEIINIYNKIKDIVKFSVNSISALEYNTLFKKYNNSHIIKSILHNQSLWDLSKKIERPYFVIIDQFASPKLYSKYLTVAKKTEFTIDQSITHAEDKYIAVACASIIARFFFLKQINEMSIKLELKILLGSSNVKIKDLAYNIINKYGIDVLKDNVKNHFKTLNEIVGE